MNTMHRSLAAIAVSLAGLSAGAAGAAEITLYEQRHFGGDGVTLHQRTPHVGRFNDRASSVLVRSGRWELCTDADFRGHCAEFGPGEYAVLDRAFNNRVSSAREVGHEGRRAERHAGRGAVTFFSQPGFGGRSFGVQGDAPDFSHRGYNDRAASMIVSDGVWEVCTDADYAGYCRRYGPGRYDDLGDAMSRHVSSARRLHRDELRHPGGPVGYEDPEHSRLVMFSGERLRGASFTVANAVGNLDAFRFNDAAASAVVEGAPWIVCTDAGFRGHCRVLGPGRHDLREMGLARVISSARPADRTRY